MLSWYCNIPFFCILAAMLAGVLTIPAKSHTPALALHTAMLAGCAVFQGLLAVITWQQQLSFTYTLGHFPAPWGNELRAGPLEAFAGCAFALVMLACVYGGMADIFEDIRPQARPLYFIMLDLLYSSMLVLVYTNDIFTAYVFVEINTIASCAIVMVKDTGRTIMATTRYLILSQLGSGLYLMAISFLYGITGHLLFSGLRPAIDALFASGSYSLPLLVITGFLTVGLAIKSALYPFHSWLPAAHGNATTASSAILSGLVLKGYIILLIKIFVQVYRLEQVVSLHITDALFVLGVAGMIMGSVNALGENNIKRMVAYSSVAQIGYVYMGIGMGTAEGLTAAFLQIFVHAAAKPLLFLCTGELVRVSGHRKDMYHLRGAAHRAPVAGAGFTLGALSMCGLPLLGGFASKLMLAGSGGFLGRFTGPVVFAALAASSVLNAMYYLPAVVLIWSDAGTTESQIGPQYAVREALKDVDEAKVHAPEMTGLFRVSAIALSACLVAVGISFVPLARFILGGLQLMIQ